ncbi:MAG: transporter substrate-binding domain-containing protein [Clostridium sp.]|jgi:L-cystine transport system substrate-binding protein|uniref:ABC transporter substrate-binding protein n=1 Tax=Clostridium sp. TaxID=1506 RepID=UPI0025BA465A|nr:transporter substrate-binding domain-containing protein [Clostridium sp.]MCH3964453.1 transporter substrate-binding domain-containing protein [Clostridium sp.]MCI1715628.1 transporter substrate-binding domain-containing protein [Clostridium sp.]MCI1799580.1 transporter substrate-binding domain-containing protein [Clostridium sp.]MCI1813812.1 transporter substrate-binding domain-containing protein [Clostridium sp.]MCI1870393.1 transporter substrate-binding domain-containing protein [Clostrid
MKKILNVLVSVMIVFTIFLSGCGKSNSANNSTKGTADNPKTVEIAILTGMAPYTYVDNNGKFQGYDYELLTMIDEMLPQYKFHYNAVEPDAAAAAVQAGTYALSASAHFITPAREKNFILSNPESYYPVNLISRKKDSFTKFEDLNGKTLVPNPPNDGLYVVLHDLAKKYPNVKFKQEEVSNYIPYADGMRGVLNGRWDVWFGGDTMFYDIIKKEPMDLYCSEPIYTAPCVAVINKNHTDLRDQINECLVKLYKEGKLSDLSKKWLNKDVWDIAKKTGALADVYKK